VVERVTTGHLRRLLFMGSMIRLMTDVSDGDMEGVLQGGSRFHLKAYSCFFSSMANAFGSFQCVGVRIISMSCGDTRDDAGQPLKAIMLNWSMTGFRVTGGDRYGLP
jgi:hypothetical protein